MRKPTGICLITSNVARLSEFYAEILEADVLGDDVFASVSVPGTALSFFSVTGMERMVPGSVRSSGNGACTVEIRVGDVDQTWERLRSRGIELVKPPTTQPWGRRSVWFRDPDGTIVNCYREVDEPGDPATIVHAYFHRLLVDRDLAVCDELLAPDYVDHDAPPGTAPGPAATRVYVELMLRDSPELTFELEELVASGNTVAIRAVWRTSELRKRGFVFVRLDDEGRLVERWSAYTEA